MIRFNNTVLKTGNRHGLPFVTSPEEISRMENFNSVSGVGQIVTGVGGRTITLDAFLVDLSFNSSSKVYEYQAKELKPLINQVGNLEVDPVISGQQKIILKNCTLKNWTPIPQPGQRAAVPMPDIINYQGGALNSRVGPGAYYLEVIFTFYQLLVE